MTIALGDANALASLSPQERSEILNTPFKFDIFMYGIYDHWYQVPIIEDDHHIIVSVQGRQSGKSAIISRRENYYAATAEIGAGELYLIVAPGLRQSENLFKYCKRHINLSPILMSQVVGGKLLMKGIEFPGAVISNIPAGRTADTSRGFAIAEVVFEEAGFIPEPVFDSMEDSMLATAGGRVFIGTPFGKSNRLYAQYDDRFRLHTIPEPLWESLKLTAGDLIIQKRKTDPDISASAHHYPSNVGLNTFKYVQCYPRDVWETVKTRNRRRYKGWIAIETEDKNIIGQPIFQREELKKWEQQIGEKTYIYVGEPQISHRNFKIAIRKARVKSVIDREIYARFSDVEGVAFNYKHIQQMRLHYKFPARPIPGRLYFGGFDIATGVEQDWTVLLVMERWEENNKQMLRPVKIWEKNDRQIGEALNMLYRLHKIWKVQKWYIDKNTLGARPLEEIQARLGKHRVGGVGFSVPDKNELVTNVEGLLEEQRCIIPEHKLLIDQFLKYQKEKSKTGRQILYHHPEMAGEHDDHLDAYMLACLCAEFEKAFNFFFKAMPKIYGSRR